jgi:lysine/ornithine N-monooxygenase
MNLLNRNVKLKRTTINFDTDDELASLCKTSDRVVITIGGKPKELPLKTRLYFTGMFNLDELNENVWETLPENVCIIGTSHSAASILMKLTEDGVCPVVKNI